MKIYQTCWEKKGILGRNGDFLGRIQQYFGGDTYIFRKIYVSLQHPKGSFA